jgi:hypothetical protein
VHPRMVVTQLGAAAGGPLRIGSVGHPIGLVPSGRALRLNYPPRLVDELHTENAGGGSGAAAEDISGPTAEALIELLHSRQARSENACEHAPQSVRQTATKPVSRIDLAAILTTHPHAANNSAALPSCCIADSPLPGLGPEEQRGLNRGEPGLSVQEPAFEEASAEALRKWVARARHRRVRPRLTTECGATSSSERVRQPLVYFGGTTGTLT